MTVDGEPAEVILVPPSPPTLPTHPAWVPPLDTGQPNALDLNDLGTLPKANFAASNQIIPITHGRDRLFGQPFVVHVDETLGYLYTAMSFCEGQIAGFEKILIGGEDALATGLAFEGVRNRGFENGDKTGWDLEINQEGTVNNTVSQTGDWGMNLLVNNGTVATQISNRLKAPPEATVITFRAWAARNALPTSLPDADSLLVIREATTIGGTLATTAGGNINTLSTGDQTVAGWQLLELEYTIPAGVVEYTIGLRTDNTGTGVGSWDFDDVSAHIFDVEDLEKEVGIEVSAYVGTQTQKFDGMLSTALTGYVDDLPGLAYIVMRVPAGSTSGFPRLEAIVQGRLVYDPRKDDTAGALGPAITLTRTSVAWFRDWEGLYREVQSGEPRFDAARRVENITLQSQAWSTSPWTSSGSPDVVEAFAYAPDGSFTAMQLTDNDGAGFEGATQVHGSLPDDDSRYTISFHVKKTTGGTSKTIAMNLAMSGGTPPTSGNIRVNSDTGAVLNGPGFVIDEGEYWRFWSTITNNSTGNDTLTFTLFPATNDHGLSADVAATQGSAVFWGAQTENTSDQGSAAPGEYIKTTTVAVARTFNTDRQGVQLPEGRGVHIENLNINVIADSNDISAAGWTLEGGTLTVAPNQLFIGHDAIDFLNDNVSANRRSRQIVTTFLDARTDVFSCIIENDDALVCTFIIRDETDASTLFTSTYTWATGLQADGGTGTSAVEALGTGPNGGEMVRISLSATGTATGSGGTGNSIGIHVYPAGTAQNALSAIVYHTQFETGKPVASSPIVVIGTGDITRGKESLSSTDVSFLNTGLGTALFIGTKHDASANGMMFSLDDGDTSDRVQTLVSSAQGRTNISETSVVSVDLNTGTVVDETQFGYAITWNTNDFNHSLDGTAGAGDTSVVVPITVNQLHLGGRGDGDIPYGGFIKQFRYYNVQQSLAWLDDASNDLILDGGSNYDPSLTAGWNFGRDMSLQGLGAAGGVGTHRVDDSTTWEFSQNPTLHFRDIVENFTGWDILDAGVIDNANCNDELIDGLPRRQSGLTMGRANTVDSWVKGHRTYMGAFLNWEGGKIRVIPNRPDVEAPGAIVLDATAGTWVDVGDQAELDVGLGDFTVECAFKMTGNTQFLVTKYNTIGYSMFVGGGSAFSFLVDDGPNSVTATSAVTINDGEWHTASVAVDRTADTITLTIDDVEETPVSISTVTGTLDTTAAFRIGSSSAGTALLNGTVDEVRVWNDVRTTTELTNNRLQEITNPAGDTSLVGYWKMNEATSAEIAPDESGNGNDGTLAGAAVFGTGNQQIIPDGVAMHIGVDDILKDSLKLKRRSLRSVPNSVAIDYEDSSGTRWFTARTQADSPRVSGGDEARRLSRVSLPGIHNASQAQREATERLNWYLTDLDCTLTVFDEGWNLTHGSIVAVTHPIGLDAKLFRVRQTTAKSGRWTLDLTEYDPAVYSDVVIADPTIPDTNLGNPLSPPTPQNLVLAEELFNYKTGTTGSRVRVTWNATGYPFLSQYLIEGYVAGAKVWQTTTQANNIVSPPVEEIVDTIGTPTDYEVRVSIQSPFASGTPAIDNVQIDGKFAIPGDPTGAVATQTFADEIDLTWVAAVDIDIWRYEIRRGTTSDTWATATSLVLIDGLAYTDTGLALGTHRYFIKAIDSVKQESANAAFVDVTLSAPTAVAGLFGFEVASEVRLNWAAVSGEFVERYRIAYSDYPIETFETTLDVVDTIRFSTKDVPEGTFTFKAYSVDKAGNEAATAAEIVIEVTSDADAFLADSYDFTFRTTANPDIVANGSLTNMVEWDVRLDDLQYYVTNMADSFAITPTDFVAADPLANYHSTGASEWLSETKDFGLLLTGSWNLTHDTVALQGVVDIALELSTLVGGPYVAFGGSAKGEYRYARVRISTDATPGTATSFVKSPVMQLKINVVPLEESGESVSSPNAGIGDTINLTREYTALKEITTQPKNTIASGSAVTSIVDNIVIGANTAVKGDGTNYLDAGDVLDTTWGSTDSFSVEFLAKASNQAGGDVVIVGKKSTVAAGNGWVVYQNASAGILTFRFVNGSTVSHNSANTAFPNDGLFHHVAFTFNQSTNDMIIYIDGVKDGATRAVALGGGLETANSLRTHADGSGGNRWTGEIDQLRIWDDIRTASEILDNKDIALDMTVAQSNLVGYWLMDGDVGATVLTTGGAVPDQTTNANDFDANASGLTYTDPGTGSLVQKINSFDVFIFDTFGQQLGEQYQWKWKAV